MFYTFYLQSEKKFFDFKNHILEVLNSFDKKIVIYENSAQQLVMECEAFNVRVTDNSYGIQFISEDYQLELNYLLWFELYYSEDRSTDQMMIKLVGKIMKSNGGQCILLSNGDKPILERREKTVVVGDSNVFATPFSYLGIEYVEGELVQI